MKVVLFSRERERESWRFNYYTKTEIYVKTRLAGDVRDLVSRLSDDEKVKYGVISYAYENIHERKHHTGQIVCTIYRSMFYLRGIRIVHTYKSLFLNVFALKLILFLIFLNSSRNFALKSTGINRDKFFNDRSYKIIEKLQQFIKSYGPHKIAKKNENDNPI